MELTREQLINILDTLGIEHESKTYRDWLPILCPNHDDKNFGNASISLKSGYINCFSCGSSEHIITTSMRLLNKSFKDTIKFFDLSNNNYVSEKSLIQRKDIKGLLDKIDKSFAHKPIKNQPELTLESFNPLRYSYTKQRGYTPEYCNNFNIKVASNTYYKDYIITPIKDSRNNMFEARKLKQYETLRRLLKKDDEEELNQLFNDFLLENKVKLKELKYYDGTLRYLLSPKTLYPAGSTINNTIFNLDNLDINKDLIISEGLGSHPKLFQGYSENSTSIFGAKVSEKQIEILKQFDKQRIIILSDNDTASYNLIWNLSNRLPNIFVFNTYTDDKDNDFIDKIKSADIIEGTRFLIRRSESFA